MVTVEETLEVISTLSDEAIEVAISKCDELGFDRNRGEVPLDESIVNLKNLRAQLVEAIENRKLIQLPTTIQGNIYGALLSISKSLTALGAGTDEVVNLSKYVEQLFSAVWQSRLQDVSGDTAVIQDTMNRMKQLEIEAVKLHKELRAALKQRDQLQTLVSELQQSQADIGGQYGQFEKSAADAAKLKKEIESLVATASNLVSLIEPEKSKAVKLSNDIEASKTQVDLLEKEIKKFKDSIVTLNAEADDLVAKLDKEITDTISSKDKIIEQLNAVHSRAESLLPGATSAGLAAAFRERKEAIANTKKRWLIYFVSSVFSLAAFVVFVIIEFSWRPASIQSSADWWQHILQRTPLMFPFIWAGWFFGRNFGHMIRLEEVYAFKETVSQSFEGYKNQMSEVSPKEGLSSLCEEAIAILSSSPLAVFERKTADETPGHSLFDWLFSRRKQKDETQP